MKRKVERLNECNKCQSTRTQYLGQEGDLHNYWYFGWCYNCQADYQHHITVESIFDREKRI